MPEASAAVRTVNTRRPIDLRLTLGLLRAAGGLDPCVCIGADGVWRATRTAGGPATIHLRATGECQIAARAWGPGADHALEAVPDLIGAEDVAEPLGGHPVVSELDKRLAGLRIGRTRAVLEALVP